MQIHPYLNFPGTCEEAMTFYAETLGAQLGEIMRFGGLPGADMPEEQKNKVLHVGLTLGDGQMIMASDTMEGMGPPHVAGTNVSLSVHPTSRADADRIFAALSSGGQVSMPMEDQFWGDYFGACTDRFGVQWMVNHNPQFG